MNGGITVAYSGVHQAYQLALAAEELGKLEYFYCSLFASTGKWGGMLVRLLGPDLLFNRRLDGLSPQKARENPWPLLNHYYRTKLRPGTVDDWVSTNSWFDHWVACQLQKSACSVFVGVETCAAESFAIARERGMTRVLDCPGIEAEFLNKLAVKAGVEFGILALRESDSAVMRERKQRELQLAHAVFVCSDLQARLLYERGVPPNMVHVLPLWADTSFWYPANERTVPRSGPLKGLFAGRINLCKGIPYLLRAASTCYAQVALTLVGAPDDELLTFLKGYEGRIKILPPCSKIALRKQYHEHDVFVLPSLGDSFGFVAMEAMSCGLPVIVTENCGVPVPDPSWRVPVMDSDAIARRLTLYADDRNLCREHGEVAAAFAAKFTPERYREQIKELFRQFLGLSCA